MISGQRERGAEGFARFGDLLELQQNLSAREMVFRLRWVLSARGFTGAQGLFRMA